MGCVHPKQSKSLVPKVQCQSFDGQLFINSKNGIGESPKVKSFQNQLNIVRVFDSVPESSSINILKRAYEMTKKDSLAPTQSSKQLKSQKTINKNKSKQQQELLTNYDCSNPQKHCQLKSNHLENPFFKHQDPKQLKIDNSSIINRKSNLVRSKRSKSAPKSQSISPQKNQLTKKAKKVTIKVQQNLQESRPSSSGLHDHESDSTTCRKPGVREPRGKSCNLFKTFEGNYIEDQDEDSEYVRRTTFKSMEGLDDRIHQK